MLSTVWPSWPDWQLVVRRGSRWLAAPEFNKANLACRATTMACARDQRCRRQAILTIRVRDATAPGTLTHEAVEIGWVTMGAAGRRAHLVFSIGGQF
jgi:hypothetical protein